MKLQELKSEPISYSTDIKWAVFLIEIQDHVNKDVGQKVTRLLEVFDSPKDAGQYVRNHHRKGNVYFISQGWCMG